MPKRIITVTHPDGTKKVIIDDADAEEGYVFNRFYADCIFMNNPIDWEDMV